MAKDKGLLWCLEQPGVSLHQGGEEERCLHCPRPLPHQDQDKASNKGMCEGDFWQGDSGEGEASEDSGQSLPCRCTQEADLDSVASLSEQQYLSAWQFLHDVVRAV